MKEFTVKEVAEKFGVRKSVVAGWFQRGLFPNAIKKETQFGSAFWVVPETDLQTFEKPRRGKKEIANPSPATLAKRQQRERDKVLAKNEKEVVTEEKS